VPDHRGQRDQGDAQLEQLIVPGQQASHTGAQEQQHPEHQVPVTQRDQPQDARSV
jgi:hypothetical protein